MKYDPEKHHRRSIRLKEYDYSQPGGYFITIVIQNRECLFGEVLDRDMVLNAAGKMIEKWYFKLKNKFSDIRCDAYTVMPNHFHAIIQNVGADPRVCPSKHKIGNDKMGEHTGSPLRRVVQWFKTMTTNEYIRGIKQNGWQPFDGKLWQRNYWEHIIRDENDLNRFREYIINNPLKWELDNENPQNLIL